MCVSSWLALPDGNTPNLETPLDVQFRGGQETRRVVETRCVFVCSQQRPAAHSTACLWTGRVTEHERLVAEMLPCSETKSFRYVILATADIQDAIAVLLNAAQRIIAGAGPRNDLVNRLGSQAMRPLSVCCWHDSPTPYTEGEWTALNASTYGFATPITPQATRAPALPVG